MTGTALGAVLLGSRRGTAFYDAAYPKHLTVLVRGEYYFVARDRVTFMKRG